MVNTGDPSYVFFVEFRLVLVLCVAAKRGVGPRNAVDRVIQHHYLLPSCLLGCQQSGHRPHRRNEEGELTFSVSH